MGKKQLNLLAPSFLSLREAQPAEKPTVFLIGKGDLRALADAVEATGCRVLGSRPGVFPTNKDEELPQVDLLITDLNVMHCNGVYTLELLQRERSDVPIIVHTNIRTLEVMGESYKAGAKAYIVQDSDDYAELQLAIGIVLAGGLYIPPHRAKDIINYLTRAGSIPSLEQRLTPTELKILGLLYLGYDKSQIAERLDLELRSVRTMVSTIRKKLHFTEYDCWRMLVDTQYPAFARQVRETPLP